MKQLIIHLTDGGKRTVIEIMFEFFRKREADSSEGGELCESSEEV